MDFAKKTRALSSLSLKKKRLRKIARKLFPKRKDLINENKFNLQKQYVPKAQSNYSKSFSLYAYHKFRWLAPNTQQQRASVQRLSPTDFNPAFLARVKRGHKLFSITTLSPSLFEFLRESPQTGLVFSYFNEIIRTKTIGMQKSDPRAISYVLRKYMINASSCIMIDDQPATLQSAAQGGIPKTILCKNSNLSKIRQELTACGLL